MKKKIIIIAVIIALVAAAVAFVELSGIKQEIKNKIEEKKMWEATSEELVSDINKDMFFTNKYGEIDSHKIIERKKYLADDGDQISELTISGETKGFILKIYASKHGDENWRYIVKDVMFK